MIFACPGSSGRAESQGSLMTDSRDEDRWNTTDHQRRVLAVARTFTSTVRLLEALSVLNGDDRIEVIFTVDASSRFSQEVPDLLRREGIRPIPWEDHKAVGADLVITASENVDMNGLDVPKLVLPHGIGFNKNVPDSRTTGHRLSGVVPPDRLGPNVWLGVSHPDFREQIRGEYPEAAERCVVIGDLAYDRMRGSMRRRDRYRRTLGVGDRTLVVLSSTWGRGSLHGSCGDLPLRLLEELPADEYAVAVVLHPNIWSQGVHSVRTRLYRALEAGLILVMPTEGWQAALIAADVVVGDHGSGTLYAAALGRPVVLAAMGEEVVPGTPPTRLAAMAPSLDRHAPLAPQIRRTIDDHEPRLYDALAARMFAPHDGSALALARCVYRLLDLPLTSRPRPRAVAEPAVTTETVVSFRTLTRVEEGIVRIWRFPAALANVRGPLEATGRHLVVSDDETDYQLWNDVSIVVGQEPLGVGAAAAWLDEALRSHYPLARIAATRLEDGCLIDVRGDRRLRARTELDPGVVASALWAHLGETGALPAGPFPVRLGSTTTALTLDFV